jgi:hypothetical protein
MAKPIDILEYPTSATTQGIIASIMQDGTIKPSSRFHFSPHKSTSELEYALEALLPNQC